MQHYIHRSRKYPPQVSPVLVVTRVTDPRELVAATLHYMCADRVEEFLFVTGVCQRLIALDQ